MKIKINIWLFAVWVFFGAQVGAVQAVEVVGDSARTVHTELVVPLRVSVQNGPSNDTLFVEVFASKGIKDGHQVRFTWFDQAQIPVGSYVAGINEEEFLGLRKIRIPKLEFVGEYALQVDVFSQAGWLLGTGSGAVKIDSGSDRIRLSAPILTREPDGFRLSYEAKNYHLRQQVIPRLQVFYLRNGERQYVLQRQLDPVELGARGKTLVEFVVEEEFPSGEYFLETWLESPSSRYLSGVMESYLQMPGSYARLANLSVDFEALSADRAAVLFEGFALVPRDRELQVRLSGVHDGEVLATETMSVPVIDGYFVEKALLEFPKMVPFFSGQVDLFTSGGFGIGDNLLTQTFNSPVVEISSEEAVVPTGEKEVDLTPREVVSPMIKLNPLGLSLIGVFLLVCLLGLLVWRRKRKKSARVF